MSSSPAEDLTLASLLAPVSKQEPCGPDLGRSPSFFSLRSLATAGLGLDLEAKNWGQVYDLGQELLAEQSKDLRVACYIAIAKLHQEGLSGVLWGLALIVGLLEQFPETLHPQRKRERVLGRDRAIAWYLEAVQAWLPAQNALSLTSQEHEELRAYCERLGKIAPQILGDASSLSATLLRSFAELPKEASPRGCSSKPTAAESEDDRPNEASPRGPTPASTRPALPLQAPEKLDLHYLGTLQRRLAAQLRSQNPLDPLSFRLHRQALWTPLLHLARLETHRIPLPTQVERRSLNAHLEGQRWPGLLEQSEDLLLRYPLCLDLQRLSSASLEAMQGGRRAAGVIQCELRGLLDQYPDLIRSSGIHDIPLADAATRAWIQKLRKPEPTRQPASSSNEDAPSKGWTPATIDPNQPVAELLAQLQAALDHAPDKINYARRALQIAQLGLPIPGLALLLLSLALDTLAPCNHLMLDRALEQACMTELLQLLQDPASRSVPAQRCPETKRLALGLGRRRLSAALPYYATT